jgi:chromosomal replication initiation ATPase DnaA
MIIELRHTLERLGTRLTRGYTCLIGRLDLERIREILHMDAQKVNEPIALSNVLIITLATRTFERFLFL